MDIYTIDGVAPPCHRENEGEPSNGRKSWSAWTKSFWSTSKRFLRCQPRTEVTAMPSSRRLFEITSQRDFRPNLSLAKPSGKNGHVWDDQALRSSTSQMLRVVTRRGACETSPVLRVTVSGSFRRHLTPVSLAVKELRE